MIQESNPLVLEILKQDNGLKMSLFEQKDIASTLRQYSLCQVSFQEIEKLSQEIVSILNKANIASEKDLFKDLARTGQILWSQLLTRSVKEKLKSTKISDLILSIDEELINIPWELLYDGDSFLCLNFNSGRLVRTRSEISPVQYRSFSNVILKMLILANPTADLKSAYLEGVNIKNQFDRKRNTMHINFKSTSIDRLYLKKNLCDYDIVHFAGHSDFEENNPKDSGWVLSDGRFTVQDILNIGSTSSLPSLVFSNACSSARVHLDFIDLDYQKRNYNLASAFLFSGTRHYIGTIRRIEDPLSFTFSKEFYTQLILGKSVGESLRLARLRLIKEYGISSLNWTSYLLYGNPDFVLFKAPARPQRQRLKRNILTYKKQVAILTLIVLTISLVIYLLTWLPSLNPNTYALFLKSKKLFQKGNNQMVIALASHIINKEPNFLAVYPLIADTYLRLGQKENALKYYFDYALYSERKQDKKNLAASFIGIGWSYQLFGDYQKAIDFYHKAINLSRENKDKLNEAKALRKLAVWYIDREDYALALELLTKSSEINRQRQHIYEYRYNLACDYFDLGLLFINKDDYSTAKEFYQKARRIFEKLKLKNELSDYYFNLGEIYLFEKEYQKALDCYSSGIKIDEAQDNKMNLAGDYNMLGELYVEMDKFNEAEDFFNRAVSVSNSINAKVELAESYYNLGLLYKKKNKINKAKEYLRLAQEIYSLIDQSGYQEIKQEILMLDAER
jgi:tetratricopeptide (TPR) repeat protein